MNNTLNHDLKLSPTHWYCIAEAKCEKNDVNKVVHIGQETGFPFNNVGTMQLFTVSFDRLDRVGNKRNSLKMNTVVTSFKIQCI